MATDNFVGSASTTIAAHDANWQLADTGAGESLSSMILDGSGFCVLTGTFKAPYAMYSGTTAAAKSEIVVPIGAFVTIGSDAVAVLICSAAGNKGFEGRIGTAQLTGQVVNAVRMASNGGFISTVSLSPTIDTASVALTMSILRTSSTNIDLVVNGTTYNVNTTGVDIASGQSGFYLVNAGTATTLKVDSWTDGVSAADVLMAQICL